MDHYLGKNIEDAKLTSLLLNRAAEVAELVDAQDLKSCVQQWTCGFDPRLRHPDQSRSTLHYPIPGIFTTF